MRAITPGLIPRSNWRVFMGSTPYGATDLLSVLSGMTTHPFNQQCVRRIIIKTFKTAILTLCLLAVSVGSQGCFLLLLGGATVGVVKYAGNTLQATHEVSLDHAWSAANGALKQLGLPVTVSKKDELSGHLEARNAQEQPIHIDLLRKTENVTQIRVAVGTFDMAANRAGAQQVTTR